MTMDKITDCYSELPESDREDLQQVLREALSQEVVEVVFIKANGELRTMKCTLNEQLGAKYTHDESKTPKIPNPDVCAVWDTELQAWRSFRWDRLKKVEFWLKKKVSP